MELSNTMKIIQNLIGDNEFKGLLHELILEYKEKNLSLDAIEPILETYSAAILLLGLFEKELKAEEFKIQLSNNKNIFVKTEDICRDYKKYIEKVKSFKSELFTKAI